MAYDHYQLESKVATAVDIASAGSVGLFSVGYQPVIVRAVVAVITTTNTVAATVLTITHRPTAGSDTSETTVDTITIPINGAAGLAYYVNGLEELLLPGEDLQITTDGGGTAGNANLHVFYEPKWEQPVNIADMVLSA